MGIETIGIIIGAVCGGFTIIVSLISVGVQYGLYTSFKNQMELQMKEHQLEFESLKNADAQQNVKYATLLSEVKSLEKTINSNNISINNVLERIADKLDRYDEKIMGIIEKLPK